MTTLMACIMKTNSPMPLSAGGRVPLKAIHFTVPETEVVDNAIPNPMCNPKMAQYFKGYWFKLLPLFSVAYIGEEVCCLLYS
jgi:hypothetical protein